MSLHEFLQKGNQKVKNAIAWKLSLNKFDLVFGNMQKKKEPVLDRIGILLHKKSTMQSHPSDDPV